MSITLYGPQQTRAMRATWMLRELGQEFVHEMGKPPASVNPVRARKTMPRQDSVLVSPSVRARTASTRPWWTATSSSTSRSPSRSTSVRLQPNVSTRAPCACAPSLCCSARSDAYLDAARAAQPAPLLRAASKYGEGTGLAPEGVEEVALTNQWSLWSLTECEGPILSLMSKGAMGAPADQAEAAEALVRPLTALEESLQDSEYLVGGRFTVADLNVSSIVGTWGVRGAKRKAAAWPASLSVFPEV